MNKFDVLLSGPMIDADVTIHKLISRHMTLQRCRDNRSIEAILATATVGVIVFELTREGMADLLVLKAITRKYPDLDIILIDGCGDRKVLARAFALGARDAFPAAYKPELLLERIEAIIRRL